MQSIGHMIVVGWKSIKISFKAYACCLKKCRYRTWCISFNKYKAHKNADGSM